MAGVFQPSPLAGATQTAKALYDAGDHPGARRLLADAIEAARPSYGENHPELLGTAHLLARLHREADDPASARRVLEEALAAGQRRWGDADPLMLAISFDLGTVAEELGNRHEARRNFTRVATAGPAVLGDDHWTVRAARDYLGERSPVAPPDGFAAAPAGEYATGPLRPAPDDQSAPADSGGPGTQRIPRELPPAPAPPGVPPIPPPVAEPLPHATPAPRPRPNPYPTQQPAPAPVAYPASGSGTGYAQLPDPAPRYASSPAPGPVAGPTQTARGGGALIAASVATVAAVLAAVVVVVVALTGDRAPQTGPENPPTGAGDANPTFAGEPPTDLRLRDDQASITITWVDPTSGTVPFVVAGGRAGQNLGAMATVDPGETRHTINGLNPRLDYCFTVLAVYATDSYATSGQVCTERGGSPTPR